MRLIGIILLVFMFAGGCAQVGRTEPPAASQTHRATTNDCKLELGYEPKITVIQRTRRHAEVLGSAEYTAGGWDTIHYQATMSGDFRCSRADGAVYIEPRGRGWAVVSGMKPLIRTPRVPGASPRYVDLRAVPKEEADAEAVQYLDTIILYVSGDPRQPDFLFFDSNDSRADKRYQVCLKRHGTAAVVELRAGDAYAIWEDDYQPLP
jgi:hypothetical protein